MDKKLLGLIIILTISIVAISRYMGEDNLKLFENEDISFKYPNTFSDATNTVIESKEGYLLYQRFENYWKEETFTIVCEECNLTLNQKYNEIERNFSLQRDIADFSLENVTINGVPAIKQNAKWVPDIYNSKYVIYLYFIHNETFYTLSFHGKDLQSIESLYDAVTQTIELK